jgi:V/A-type H+-transporting ATPase subunit E
MDKEIYSKVHQENAEEICRKIREDAAYESRVILEKAQKEAENVVGEAKQEAEKNKEAVLKELDREVQALKERIFSTLNLDKRRIVLEEKNKIINEVLEIVKREAQNFRQSQEYVLFLKKAILEGVEVIGGTDISIFYSFLDEKIIDTAFIKEISNLRQDKINKTLSFTFYKSEFSDIGVIIQSKNGRCIYDNRFTSRLNRLYENIYMNLLKEAF